MKCPACGLENREGILICERCGKSLANGAAVGSTRKLEPPETPPYVLAGTVRFPNRTRLSIKVVGDDRPPVVAEIDEQISLGRVEEGSTGKPDVDLAPYRGHEKGVSRLHAVLTRGKGVILITDVGSTNGVWINDKRLPANTPTAIQDGTHLWLGRLELVVYFTS